MDLIWWVIALLAAFAVFIVGGLRLARSRREGRLITEAETRAELGRKYNAAKQRTIEHAWRTGQPTFAKWNPELRDYVLTTADGKPLDEDDGDERGEIA